jgi:hypothetical protein
MTLVGDEVTRFLRPFQDRIDASESECTRAQVPKRFSVSAGTSFHLLFCTNLPAVLMD